MSDTQWPRWVVLHQERDGKPHQYAGSVHGPDAEIALLNARDVFTRRPECVSLWVVRARDILALTAEEEAADHPPSYLEDDDPRRAAALTDDEIYYVFQKIGQRTLHQHAGEIVAASAADALRKALESFRCDDVMVWWVFGADAVKKSTPEDIEGLFAIAETKLYRDQGQYHTVAALKRIKEQREQERAADAG